MNVIINYFRKVTMNELLPQQINEKKANRLFAVIMLLFCLLPVLINCLALVPLYAALNTDAVYASTSLPIAVKYVQDFFDLTAFSVSYALIIFSVLLLSRKQARKIVLFYALVFFVKIPIRLFMNIPIYGSLGSAADITVELIYMSVYFALEMLQLWVVYLFATTDSSKYLRSVAFEKSKKAKSHGKQQNQSVVDFKVLPIAKIINIYNPLQRSALKMSALICAVKIFIRIINDITFGAPTSFGEVLIMIIYYLSDLLYGVVAYIIALLVFNTVYERLKLGTNTKKKTDEDSAPSVLED